MRDDLPAVRPASRGTTPSAGTRFREATGRPLGHLILADGPEERLARLLWSSNRFAEDADPTGRLLDELVTETAEQGLSAVAMHDLLRSRPFLERCSVFAMVAAVLRPFDCSG